LGPGGEAPQVAEPLELGLDRAPEAVVRMTCVALAFADVAVLEVGGGERVALDVLEVLHEGRHHVTGTACPDGGRLFEPVGEGEEGDHHGHQSHPHEEPAATGRGDGATTQTSPCEEKESQVEEGEGDAEPSHPLAGRADPSVRERHASRNLSLHRDRREKDDERGGPSCRLHNSTTWRRGSSSTTQP